MSRRAALAATLAAMALAPAASLAQRAAADPLADCERHLLPVTVTVDVAPIRFSVDGSQGSRALSALEKKPTGKRVLGRSVATFRHELDFRISALKMPDGRYCARPSVAARIAYEPTTVFVASEYPPGSCEHRLVLEHEQRHIDVWRQHLDELAKVIRADLRKQFGNGVLVFASTDEALRTVKTATQDLVRSRESAGKAALGVRQAAVDSAEELSRMSDFGRVCGPAK